MYAKVAPHTAPYISDTYTSSATYTSDTYTSYRYPTQTNRNPPNTFDRTPHIHLLDR
jgi:hypothetical protein